MAADKKRRHGLSFRRNKTGGERTIETSQTSTFVPTDRFLVTHAPQSQPYRSPHGRLSINTRGSPVSAANRVAVVDAADPAGDNKALCACRLRARQYAVTNPVRTARLPADLARGRTRDGSITSDDRGDTAALRSPAKAVNKHIVLSWHPMIQDSSCVHSDLISFRYLNSTIHSSSKLCGHCTMRCVISDICVPCWPGTLPNEQSSSPLWAVDFGSSSDRGITPPHFLCGG